MGPTFFERKSVKVEKDEYWYKADYTGYEGLAEYVTSRLLAYSNLQENEYVKYDVEQIKYRNQIFTGAKSKDFLTEDWQIITLERLFQTQFSYSLNAAIWRIDDVRERMLFCVIRQAGLQGLETLVYMTKLLTLDAFFKNEDRHTHNIAILMNGAGKYKLCPDFR